MDLLPYFLVELLGELGPPIAASALAGLGLEGIKKIFASLRAGTRPAPALVDGVVGTDPDEHLRWIKHVWLRVFDNRLELEEIHEHIEDVIGKLGEMGTAIRQLESDPKTDREAINFLTNRTKDLYAFVEGLVLDNKEQLKALQEIRERILPPIVPRFTVLRDLDGDNASQHLMQALDLHAEKVYLDNLVDRDELLGKAPSLENTLITGLPGAGKTTLMHQIAMRDKPQAVVVVGRGFGQYQDHIRYLQVEDLPEEFILVYDNIHVNPSAFQSVMIELKSRFPGMVLLCACRTADMPRVDQMIAGFRETLNIGDPVEVPPLTRSEADAVVRLCEQSWDITVPEETREWLVKRGGETYATPLYFISLLAPIRLREDRTVRLADLVALPKEALDSVLAIWQEYFKQLTPKCRSFLQAVRLAKDMHMPAGVALVSRLVGEFLLVVDPRDQMEAQEELEQRLWLSVSDGEYSCYDIQLEAVEIPRRIHESFLKWVLDLPVDDNLKLTFLNQGGLMECDRSFKMKDGATRTRSLKAAADLWQAGARLCEDRQEPKEQAMFLNNVSTCYSDLAGSAESDQHRRKYQQQAVTAIEEAIEICKRLNLAAELAGSLNNAAGRYFNLADSAQNDQQRREYLDQAVEGIEEAIEIYKGQNLPADLAMGLNNASVYYSNLAGSAESDHHRRDYLQQAVEAIEEAIEICKRLKLPAKLAASLNNASEYYSTLAGSAENDQQRRKYVQQAITAIEEAIEIYKRLKLPGDLAMSLNNASNCYADLAVSAESDEQRREYLKQAVKPIEKAIEIRRRLDLAAGLAMSLSNASIFYAGLAGSAESDEQRREYLKQAVKPIQEAIEIRRRLDLTADLATSLNNASNLYYELAGSIEDDQQRRNFLQQAVKATQEAIEIRRRLNLPADLAGSLNNASNFYSKLADSAESGEQRRDYLQQAVQTIEEAIEIHRRLDLPADLAVSLGTSANVWQALAAAEDSEQAEFAHWIRAAECIDEAISLLEQTGLNYRLVRGYPDGVRMHLPLLQERPESVEKTRIYAEKAAALLKAYHKPEEAERFAELARRLSGEQPD